MADNIANEVVGRTFTPTWLSLMEGPQGQVLEKIYTVKPVHVWKDGRVGLLRRS